MTSITEDVWTRIDQTAESIMNEVGSTYVTSDGFEEELSTRFTQTEEGWEMTFNQFRQWVEAENGETQTALKSFGSTSDFSMATSFWEIETTIYSASSPTPKFP